MHTAARKGRDPISTHAATTSHPLTLWTCLERAWRTDRLTTDEKNFIQRGAEGRGSFVELSGAGGLAGFDSKRLGARRGIGVGGAAAGGGGEGEREGEEEKRRRLGGLTGPILQTRRTNLTGGTHDHPNDCASEQTRWWWRKVDPRVFFLLRWATRSDLMPIMLTARRAGIAAAVVLLACAGKVLGCGGPPEEYLRGAAQFEYGGVFYQGCWLDEDCVDLSGTFCGVFVCLCNNDTEVFCHANKACVPKATCVDLTPLDGSGGSGGAGGMPSTNMCDEASDCPQPPDARCGYAECKAGKCLLVITPGPADSQKRGDCKTTYCDTAGNAKEANDGSDFYNDGKPCTMDFCDNGLPRNEAQPNGVACPEVGDGVCYEGDCVECYGTAPVNYCPKGLDCDGVYCVSMLCVQNQTCGDQCRPCIAGAWCDADLDCDSGVCDNNSCAVPTCQDGVRNGGETGLDCGALSCPNKCPDGEGCALPNDCISGVCWGSECLAPTCTDGVQNGAEGGIDCGGPCSLPCKT